MFFNLRHVFLSTEQLKPIFALALILTFGCACTVTPTLDNSNRTEFHWDLVEPVPPILLKFTPSDETFEHLRYAPEVCGSEVLIGNIDALSTRAKLGQVCSGLLLFEILVNKDTPQQTAHEALLHLLLRMGPAKVFAMLSTLNDLAPTKISEFAKAELRRAGGKKIVILDGAFIDDLNRVDAFRAMSGAQRELKEGSPWQTVYSRYQRKLGKSNSPDLSKSAAFNVLHTTAFGNLGDFVISSDQSYSFPYKPFGIEDSEYAQLLSLKEGETIILEGYGDPGAIKKDQNGKYLQGDEIWTLYLFQAREVYTVPQTR